MEYALAALLLSLGCNGYLLLRKTKHPKNPLAIDAQQLLHDLTRGSATLKIEVLNPGDFFLRSPRE